MAKKFALIGLAVVAVAAAVLLYSNRPYTYKGSSFAPFPLATDFRLTDQYGRAFRLSDQRGKVVLLFFGYTHCPDICPATLVEFKRIRNSLDEMWDQAVLVFVTEDPQRDTQERMREYLDGIDPTIIGLTGSADELQPVWEAYYVGREIISNAQQAEESGEHTHAVGDYTIAHTSRIYVIDRQSQLRLTFPGDMPVQDMVADVYHLIEEPTTKNQGG